MQDLNALTNGKVRIVISDCGPFSFMSRSSTREVVYLSEVWRSIDHYYEYHRHLHSPLSRHIKHDFVSNYQLHRTITSIPTIEYINGFPLVVNVSRKYKNIKLPQKYEKSRSLLLELTIEKFKQHLYLLQPFLSTKKCRIVDTENFEYGKILEKVRSECKPLLYRDRCNFSNIDITKVVYISDKLDENSDLYSVRDVLKELSSTKYVNMCLQILNSINVSETYTSYIDIINRISSIIKNKVKKDRNEVAVLLAIFVSNQKV